MDTFILHVIRQSAFTAAAASTKVIIDGCSQASLKMGGSQDFTLPRKPTTVLLLTSVALGKDIQKTLTIDPRDSREVTLLFTYKFNAKSLIPFGGFTHQQSFIEAEVILGPSVSASASPSSAFAAEQPQQTASPTGETKFCTECGTPNPKTAKFCQGCGHPF